MCLNLCNWQVFSSLQKQECIKILIDYYSQKLRFSKTNVQFLDVQFSNSYAYYHREKDLIIIDPLLLKQDLPNVLITVLHEIAHKNQCEALDKRFNKFAFTNLTLSASQKKSKFEAILKNSQKDEVLFNLIEYIDLINTNDFALSNLPSSVKDNIEKVSRARYSLQPSEVDAERFAHEHTVFIIRSAYADKNKNSKQEGYMYNMLKLAYKKYEEYEENLTQQSINQTEAMRGLWFYYNNKLQELEKKYSWDKAQEIIDFCSAPQLKGIAEKCVDIDWLSEIIINNSNASTIAYLVKIPLINVGKIRGKLIESKDAGALLLFDYYAKVSPASTVDSLRLCKINEDILNPLQLFEKSITNSKEATKLFLLLSKHLSLEALKSLSINRMVDKELWASVIRQKIENKQQQAQQFIVEF